LRDSRLTGLDFLRALACVLVFMHHSTQRLNFNSLYGGWLNYYHFFNMGAFGVGIFFLLSGFLLTRPYWVAFDADEPMPSLKTYAVRRAARIVPGYYLSLTVTFILVATVFATPLTGQLWQRYVAGLLFVNEFHWLTLFPVEINGPLWSIGMEVASYAMLPLGLLALFRLRPVLPRWKGRVVFIGVVCLALVGQCLMVLFVPQETYQADFSYGMVGGAKYWMPEFNFIGFFAVFALGGLTAGLSTLWRGKPIAVADVLAIAGLVLAGWAMWSRSADYLKPEAMGFLGIPYDFPIFHLGIALALLTLPHARWLPFITELPPIRYIAKISFGIYIWHYIVLELIRQYGEPRFQWGGIADTSYWFELVLAAAVLSLIAGSLSWFGIEAPVLNWVQRRERRNRSAAETAASPAKLHA